MAQTLVKFRHVEDMKNEHIKAVWTDNPLTILELSKATGTVILEDEPYTYEFSELIPAKGREFVDVLMIYVDGYFESEYFLN